MSFRMHYTAMLILNGGLLGLDSMPDDKILQLVSRPFTKILVLVSRPVDQGLGLEFFFKGLDSKSAY